MMDWAIGTAIAVSILIILVLVVRRPFARIFGARAAYALWVLPFIRLIMPEVTIPRIFPQSAAAPAPAMPMDITVTPEMLAALPAEPSFIDAAQPYILPVFFGLWIAGAIAFFLYHWTRQASLMDRLSYASEPALSLTSEIGAAARAAGLKHIPQVRISDEKAGPLVAGFFRPAVILPDNFMTAFNPRQRHYALLHEFMHIKRGDIWVAAAWLGFRAVNWPNPLVHYAAKHFRSDQEAACDASVLAVTGNNNDSVSGYAETLIHAAKAAITDGRASPQPSALALTIHHPLKERLMILGTHRKTSNWRSRTAAAVMIIGAATLSAPLIQADAHPETEVSEEELAGKSATHNSKSIIKRMVKTDGDSTAEHYEIEVNDGEVKAYKISPSGDRQLVEVEDVKGAKTSWFGSKGDGFSIRTDNGSTHMNFGKHPKFPKPPKPRWLSKDGDKVIVLRSDTFEGLEGLEGLEALESLEGIAGLERLKGLEGLAGLEKLKALKHLDKLDGFETFTVFADDGDKRVLKLRMTESKLAAARAMLEDTEVDASDSREMAKAKRELEKARKALKAAERALKDAE